MPDAAWHALKEELDRWVEAERVAEFWWRDDDARTATPAYRRLLDVSRECGVPVAIAAVPADAAADLSDSMESAPGTCFLQHGYAHHNHAPDGEKKIELGPHRRADVVVAEIATGWQALERVAGAGALPVMVPPWNRIAPFLVPMLPEMRFVGLSTFGPRARPDAVPGLRQVNCHIDLIDWRGTRRFAGEGAVLDQAIGHLRARRQEHADPQEPTGLMTHHQVHDDDCWRFVGRFLDQVSAHPAARWLDARVAFGTGSS